ncbi:MULTISPECIES: hypothetical protein [unclassified Streptomyces]|uniref:hypothetical protein n=1 Tax=unclassified Streptomyces TaxID=2593676 RepID=UPI000369CE76|nr:MULTISPECIES: hypothetical protein [unclassified Streptomyces]MYT30762.1 hypothetical protein [Streptomyces sp. SID8354]
MSGIRGRGFGGRVRRLLRHEGRWLASLVWWVARRRVGVPVGARALPYAGAQAAMLYGLAFVFVVETVGVSVLLRDTPWLHAVMLVVDVYTVLMVLGSQAAAVTRPHVVGADGVVLRDGARMTVRIPLERIASVRYDLRFGRSAREAGAKDGGARDDGTLELAVGGQTSVTLELAEPVVAVRLLGRRETVRTVRFHADDARGAVRAVREAMEAVSVVGGVGGAEAVTGVAGADGAAAPVTPATPVTPA